MTCRLALQYVFVFPSQRVALTSHNSHITPLVHQLPHLHLHSLFHKYSQAVGGARINKFALISPMFGRKREGAKVVGGWSGEMPPLPHLTPPLMFTHILCPNIIQFFTFSSNYTLTLSLSKKHT